MDRYDFEVRAYLTVRPGGSVEWQMVAFPLGETSEWLGGGVDRLVVGHELVPPMLTVLLRRGVRTWLREALEQL